eukprot:365457-Chlamydomonas_euryale.AAC.5
MGIACCRGRPPPPFLCASADSGGNCKKSNVERVYVPCRQQQNADMVEMSMGGLQSEICTGSGPNMCVTVKYNNQREPARRGQPAHTPPQRPPGARSAPMKGGGTPMKRSRHGAAPSHDFAHRPAHCLRSQPPSSSHRRWTAGSYVIEDNVQLQARLGARQSWQYGPQCSHKGPKGKNRPEQIDAAVKRHAGLQSVCGITESWTCWSGLVVLVWACWSAECVCVVLPRRVVSFAGVTLAPLNKSVDSVDIMDLSKTGIHGEQACVLRQGTQSHGAPASGLRFCDDDTCHGKLQLIDRRGSAQCWCADQANSSHLCAAARWWHAYAGGLLMHP